MQPVTRRAFTIGLATAGLTSGLNAPAQTGYPSGATIKLVVGFPAGGAQDIIARVTADRLAAKWNVPTVVENVAGAGGNLAMDRVAKGPADGTQICVLPPGFATNQFLYARMPFSPENDFIPLVHVATLPNLLCVRKDLPVNSVAELVSYAKANPGKLNYASSGNGTSIHLSAELFKRMANIEMTHVAYRGSAPALNDLLGGNVDLIFDNISSIISHARSGSVKPLGITSAKRSALAPEYSPVADHLPGYETLSWAGLGVRAGTPPDICEKIEADSREVCKEQSLRDRLAVLVAEPIGAGAAQFAAFVASERTKWGKLITDLRVRVE